jgi:hypothetical protein
VNNPNEPNNPADMSAALAAMRESILIDTRVLLGLFAPSVPPEAFEALVDGLVAEQTTFLTELMPLLVAGVGNIRVDVRDRNGGAGSFTASVSISKGKEDCGQALPTALLYALVLNPSVRALLQVYGIGYRFVFEKPKVEPLVRLS